MKRTGTPRQLVLRWNWDKPHRCPACHTSVVYGEKVKSWTIYQCCECKVRFAKHPWAWKWMPSAPILCGDPDHGDTRGIEW